MAYSKEPYIGTGTASSFNVPFEYTKEEDVKVYVDGVEVARTFTSPNTVSVAPAPPEGSRVLVARITDASERVVNFQNGSVLNEADLDASAQQVFFLAQEALDRAEQTISYDNAGNLDAKGLRIVNVGNPVNPTDAVNLQTIQIDYPAVSEVADHMTAVEVVAADLGAMRLVETDLGLITDSPVATPVDTSSIVTVSDNITDVQIVAANIDKLDIVGNNAAALDTVTANIGSIVALAAEDFSAFGVATVQGMAGHVMLDTADIPEGALQSTAFINDLMDNPTGSPVALESHTPNTGGAWSRISSYDGIIPAGSSYFTGSVNFSAAAYINTTTPSSPDHWVEATVQQATAYDQYVGLMVRRIDSLTNYECFIDYGSLRLCRNKDYSRVDIAPSISAPSVGTIFKLRLQAEGSVISVYINDVLVMSAVDSNIAGAGSVGLYAFEGGRFYDFKAGTFTAVTKRYFTEARARASISAGTGISYDKNTGVISATGSAPVTSVAGKTGAVTLSTSDVSEDTNLYYTDSRVRAAISVTGSGGSYNSSTGVITLSGGGGLSNLTEALVTATPYSTSSALASLTATNATATDVGIALIPKGNGALTGAKADNASSGGNARGIYAVDWQRSRNNSDEVASGQYSVIAGGKSNKATGNYSAVAGGQWNYVTGSFSFAVNYNNAVSGGSSAAFGDSNVVSGAQSVAFGGNNNANADYCVVSGKNAKTRGVSYARIHGSPASGYTQSGEYICSRTTTDATTTTLTTDNAAPTSGNVVYHDTVMVYSVRARVAARNTSNNDAAAWELKALFKRGASGAPSLVGSVSQTVIAKDTGASAWDATLAVDTSRNAVVINVTGAAATTIAWLGQIDTLEVY